MSTKAVVLFAGCGGATEGVARAGVDVTLAVDNWQTACLSHRLWHPNMLTVRADCNAVPFRGTTDLIWASPSCKPYSTANRSPKRGRAHPEFYDLRNLIRYRAEWGARWLIVENVPGMAWSHEGRAELELMRREADRCGVAWSLSIVAASSLGVAQYRRRVFIVVGPRMVRIPNGTDWVPRSCPPPTAFRHRGPGAVRGNGDPHRRQRGEVVARVFGAEVRIAVGTACSKRVRRRPRRASHRDRGLACGHGGGDAR